MKFFERLKFLVNKNYATKVLDDLANNFAKELLFKSHCKHCKTSFKDFTDKFKCSFCNELHCARCRLPENHDCSGNPRQPSGRIREVYSGGSISAYGK